MTKSYKNYLTRLIQFTGILGLLYVAYINLFPGLNVPSKSIAIFIVLLIVTAGTHFISKKNNSGDAHKMVVNTILAIVLKLISYGVFAIVLIIADKENAIPNIVLFFILYLFFTVFDIYQQKTSSSTSKSV